MTELHVSAVRGQASLSVIPSTLNIDIKTVSSSNVRKS